MTVISSAVKSVDGSDSVNVIVAVSPAFNALSLVVILIVGTTVSMLRVIDPEVFSFPAASVNLGEETIISPFAVLLSVGVNVAV